MTLIRKLSRYWIKFNYSTKRYFILVYRALSEMILPSWKERLKTKVAMPAWAMLLWALRWRSKHFVLLSQASRHCTVWKHLSLQGIEVHRAQPVNFFIGIDRRITRSRDAQVILQNYDILTVNKSNGILQKYAKHSIAISKYIHVVLTDAAIAAKRWAFSSTVYCTRVGETFRIELCVVSEGEISQIIAAPHVTKKLMNNWVKSNKLDHQAIDRLK